MKLTSNLLFFLCKLFLHHFFSVFQFFYFRISCLIQFKEIHLISEWKLFKLPFFSVYNNPEAYLWYSILCDKRYMLFCDFRDLRIHLWTRVFTLHRANSQGGVIYSLWIQNTAQFHAENIIKIWSCVYNQDSSKQTWRWLKIALCLSSIGSESLCAERLCTTVWKSACTSFHSGCTCRVCRECALHYVCID